MNTEIIIALISAIGGTVIGFVLTEIKARKSEHNATQKALKILLRRELRNQCSDWSSLGYITQGGLLEYTDTLSVYEMLVGQNDFIEAITNKIKSLPVKD